MPDRLGLNFTHCLIDELSGHITGWIIDGKHVIDEPFRAPPPEMTWVHYSAMGGHQADVRLNLGVMV